MESQFIALLVLSYVSVFSQAPLLVLYDRFTQSTHQFKQCFFPTIIEPTVFRNLASKVPELQVHVTTLGNKFCKIYSPQFFRITHRILKIFSQFDFMQCRQRLLWKSRVLYFLPDCFSAFQRCKGILYW